MHNSKKIKYIKTAVIFVVLCCVYFQPLRSLVFENGAMMRLDIASEEYIESSLVRAGAAFASARVTNAIISVIQGSSLDVTPAGLGISIAIFEALDPLNDLIESFSWVMLVSVSSLGIQRILIEISPWLGITIFAFIGFFLWGAGYWTKKYMTVDLVRIGKNIVILGIALRFAVPLMVIANDYIYDSFLDVKYQHSFGEIEKQNRELKKAIPKDFERTEEDSGLMAKARQIKESLTTMAEGVNNLKEKAGEFVNNIVWLIAIFVLNTILFPIAFLWGFVHLIRGIIGRNIACKFENEIKNKIIRKHDPRKSTGVA
ncbi:MAG: hypothetical protein K9L30_17795 [Desulfobacterales bacterium]|nr:hypothetical protein [Desulfobacterales bacterium]